MEEQDLSFLSRQMNSIAAPDAHDSVSMSGLHFGEDGYSVRVYNMAQQLFSRKLKGKALKKSKEVWVVANLHRILLL